MLVNGRNYSTYGAAYMRYPGYVKLQIQRYQMQTSAQQALANQAMYSTSMFSATLGLSQGLAGLTAKAALQRMQDSLTAKKSQITSSASGINITA